jgi:putative hydrolases of HD superfamily
MTDRLSRQLTFLLELDKAKQVLRQNPLTDGSRRENDAEHMWHLALLVLVLAEHSKEPIDVLRVLKMVLVHDIVEIDAGDVFVYDVEARQAKEAKEREAADRIYGLLPDDQRDELRAVWEEFEERRTPESRFAAAVDRLQPLLLNTTNGGTVWKQHGITAERVLEVNRPIGDMAPDLWERAQELVAQAVERGYLEP